MVTQPTSSRPKYKRPFSARSVGGTRPATPGLDTPVTYRNLIGTRRFRKNADSFRNKGLPAADPFSNERAKVDLYKCGQIDPETNENVNANEDDMDESRPYDEEDNYVWKLKEPLLKVCHRTEFSEEDIEMMKQMGCTEMMRIVTPRPPPIDIVEMLKRSVETPPGCKRPRASPADARRKLQSDTIQMKKAEEASLWWQNIDKIESHTPRRYEDSPVKSMHKEFREKKLITKRLSHLWDNVTHLNWAYWGLGDDCLSVISSTCPERVTRLWGIDMTSNHLTTVGLSHLLSVASPSILLHLYLGSNRLDLASMHVLGNSLLRSDWPALQTLDLSHNTTIGDAGVSALCGSLACALQLRTLSLRAVGLGRSHEGAQALGDLLSSHITLTSLDVSHNYIHGPGACALLQGLIDNEDTGSVAFVWLQGNQLGMELAPRIGHLLAHYLRHTTLCNHLQLAYNDLRAPELEEMAEALESRKVHNLAVAAAQHGGGGGERLSTFSLHVEGNQAMIAPDGSLMPFRSASAKMNARRSHMRKMRELVQQEAERSNSRWDRGIGGGYTKGGEGGGGAGVMNMGKYLWCGGMTGVRSIVTVPRHMPQPWEWDYDDPPNQGNQGKTSRHSDGGGRTSRRGIFEVLKDSQGTNTSKTATNMGRRTSRTSQYRDDMLCVVFEEEEKDRAQKLVEHEARQRQMEHCRYCNANERNNSVSREFSWNMLKMATKMIGTLHNKRASIYRNAPINFLEKAGMNE